MGRQKGGLRWRQGTDGCIFKPSVSCKRATQANPANTISKIIPKGSHDERVEEVIEKNFPNVVAGKGVLIAKQRCVPDFKTQNENMSSNIEQSCTNPLPPCFRMKFLTPENYTNFIVEEYDTTFFHVSDGLDLDDSLRLLQRAINAAIAMVPDEGPWVIGLDFHSGNIFVKYGVEPISSLADWGRMLVIENPKDIASVQKGLQECFDNLKKQNLVKNHFVDYAASYDTTGRLISYEEYGMFPIFIRHAFDRLLNLSNTAGLTDDIHTVRMLSVYGIFTSCIEPKQAPLIPLASLLGLLMKTKSQKDIINAIHKLLPNYVKLDTFFPDVAAPVPTIRQGTTNLYQYAFGGRKTRRTKKALKKHSKKHTRR